MCRQSFDKKIKFDSKILEVSKFKLDFFIDFSAETLSVNKITFEKFIQAVLREAGSSGMGLSLRLHNRYLVCILLVKVS